MAWLLTTLTIAACAGPSIDTRQTTTGKVIDGSTRAGIAGADVLVRYQGCFTSLMAMHARCGCIDAWRGRTDQQGEFRYPTPVNGATAHLTARKDGYVAVPSKGKSVVLEAWQPTASQRIEQLAEYVRLRCGEDEKPVVHGFWAPLVPEIEAAIKEGTPEARSLRSDYRYQLQSAPPPCHADGPVACGRQPKDPGG